MVKCFPEGFLQGYLIAFMSYKTHIHKNSNLDFKINFSGSAFYVYYSNLLLIMKNTECIDHIIINDCSNCNPYTKICFLSLDVLGRLRIYVLYIVFTSDGVS